jgi:hypothetical protein
MKQLYFDESQGRPREEPAIKEEVKDVEVEEQPDERRIWGEQNMKDAQQ